MIEDTQEVKEEFDLPDPNYIPDSWVDEQGIRHAVIFETGLPERMRLEKINGEWKLKDIRVF